jgi:hypothetical protein
MLILAVAALGADMSPAVSFQLFDECTDFHLPAMCKSAA